MSKTGPKHKAVDLDLLIRSLNVGPQPRGPLSSRRVQPSLRLLGLGLSFANAHRRCKAGRASRRRTYSLPSASMQLLWVLRHHRGLAVCFAGAIDLGS